MSSAPTHPLQRLAYSLRREALTMIYQARSGHPAGALGMAEVFTSLYFDKVLRFDPKRPDWDRRDYFLLSNGHICPIFYATLARAGFFPRSELSTFRQLNSRLQGHPHFTREPHKRLPGVENTSGPLGQGLSQAAGIAMALQLDERRNKVFCLMSDGEQQEGQTWEAYQFIAHHRLHNLIGIIDYNDIQISGKVSETMSLGQLKLKLLAFGLQVHEVDAHDLFALGELLRVAKQQRKQSQIIIARSVPGKGVSFMERDYRWHGKAPTDSEYHQAISELTIKEKACKHKH